MRFELVIFDMDGTIVDSEDFIVWSFMEAGRLLSVELDPNRIRAAIGLPLESFIESTLSNLPRDVVYRLIETRRAIARSHWRSMVRLFPDVIPALETLKSRGLKLAVASSSVTERIVEFLGYFGVLGYFDALSGVEPGVKGKPAPDVITRVLGRLGVSPDKAVYVGDRLVDCIAARSAGVEFILIDRSNTWSNLGDCPPLAVIESLLELARLI